MSGKPTSPKVVSIADQKKVVDEFGAIDAELAATKPMQDRLKLLREQILGWFEDRSAEDEFAVDGNIYTVTVSARKKERRITSMAKLFRRLGEQLFVALAQIRLKDFDEHIPITERGRFIEEERTGARSLKAIPRAAAAKKAA